MPQAEGALRGSDHTGLCMGTEPKVEGLEVRFGNKEVVLVSLWLPALYINAALDESSIERVVSKRSASVKLH